MASILLSWGLFALFVIVAIIYLLWSKNHRNCLFISGFFVIMGFITRFTTSTILNPLYTSSELMTATQTMITSYFIIALVFAVWGIYLLIYRHLEEKAEDKAFDDAEKAYKGKQFKDEKTTKNWAKTVGEYKKIHKKKMGLTKEY